MKCCALGFHRPARNLYYIVFLRRVEICTPKKWCEAAVRHSGWVASAALFVCAHVLGLGLEVQAATGITALEARRGHR